MRLLAIDVGRTFGWAVGELTDPRPVEIGSQSLPTSSVRDLLAARLDAFSGWLTATLEHPRPDLIVMAERFRARTGGEAATNYGLDGMVRLHAYRARIPVLCQPENTVRKEMLGKGAGTSDEMKALAMAWCERQGIVVVSHHEADAAVFWVWACRELVRSAASLPSGQRSGEPQDVAVGNKRNKVAQKLAEARLNTAREPV